MVKNFNVWIIAQIHFHLYEAKIFLSSLSFNLTRDFPPNLPPIPPRHTHKISPNLPPDRNNSFKALLKPLSTLTEEEKEKVKSAYKPSGPLAGAYPRFCSMKWLGVFLLPPGWDASPLQGYPQQWTSIKCAGTHLNTWVERGTVRVKCLAQEHNTMSLARPGLEPGPLDPETSALTMRPPRLTEEERVWK